VPTQRLSSRLAGLHGPGLNQAFRQTMGQLCDELDGLPYRDAFSRKVYVDQVKLEELLRDRGSDQFGQGFLGMLQRLDPERFSAGPRRAVGQREAILWEDFVTELSARATRDLRADLGIPRDASVQTVGEALLDRVPSWRALANDRNKTQQVFAELLSMSPIRDPAQSIDSESAAERARSGAGMQDDEPADRVEPAEEGAPDGWGFVRCAATGIGWLGAWLALGTIMAVIAVAIDEGSWARAWGVGVDTFLGLFSAGVIVVLLNCFWQFIIAPIFNP
jgi:hypothetical protein